VKKIAFISDMFAEHYQGGAELTTEAIVRGAATYGHGVAKIVSTQITVPLLEQNKDVHYIVCNFAGLEDKVKLYMCKNVDYSIIEYDYKFCEYRSMKKHQMMTGQKCDCTKHTKGKINSAFYGYAKKVWFMSEGQRGIFLEQVNVLKKENTEVLSSVFSDGDLRFMNSIKDNEKNDKYLILGSKSWIKGTEACAQHAEKNNLPYEIVHGLPYHELLIKMSTSKGLIFLPLGYDTCPRFVIEARLLGCKLILNEHVQHKDEDWFKTQDSTYEYLRQRTSTFWEYYE
jgi:hypothetical protein